MTPRDWNEIEKMLENVADQETVKTVLETVNRNLHPSANQVFLVNNGLAKGTHDAILLEVTGKGNLHWLSYYQRNSSNITGEYYEVKVEIDGEVVFWRRADSDGTTGYGRIALFSKESGLQIVDYAGVNLPTLDRSSNTRTEYSTNGTILSPEKQTAAGTPNDFIPLLSSIRFESSLKITYKAYIGSYQGNIAAGYSLDG